MQTLIFATNNQNKVDEVRQVLDGSFILVTLSEAGINTEIPEPHPTLEENATEKSRTIHRMTGKNCFSEDTGLEVAALNGRPGVKSARYAGERYQPDENTKKLLKELSGNFDRSARFRTIISLIFHDKEYLFEGICEGHIALEPRGEMGFGYDPIFIPKGSNRSFAEMTMAEKNRYSHRKKATTALIEFLKSNA